MEREKEAEIRAEAILTNFMEKDEVRTQNDIINNLDKAVVSGFVHQLKDDVLSFHHICTSDIETIPKLKCSLLISSDLSFSAFSHGSPLKRRSLSKLYEVANGGKIESMTALSNVLAALKAIVSDDDRECEIPSTQLLEETIDLLQKYMNLPDVNEKSMKLLLFIIDQLRLIIANDHGKRYSSDTYITCFT